MRVIRVTSLTTIFDNETIEHAKEIYAWLSPSKREEAGVAMVAQLILENQEDFE